MKIDKTSYKTLRTKKQPVADIRVDVKKPEWDVKKNKTVVILGTAGTLITTPWDDPERDYWACAPVITHDPSKGHRIDVLFELHHMEYWINIIDRLNLYMDENPKSIIFMQNKNGPIKNSVKFPIAELQGSIGHPLLAGYFTSTIAYMIAMAIFMGYEKIELYGVHMSSDEEEYSGQRSCCEAWLNYGLGKGVDYFIPEASDVMRNGYLYGYEQEKGIVLDLIHRKEGLVAGVDELKKRMEKILEDLHKNEGAVLDCEQLIREYRKKGG